MTLVLTEWPMCSLPFLNFQNSRTFNPADYTESSATDGFGIKSEIWETGQNDADDGTGKMLEEMEGLEWRPVANCS